MQHAGFGPELGTAGRAGSLSSALPVGGRPRSAQPAKAARRASLGQCLRKRQSRGNVLVTSAVAVAESRPKAPVPQVSSAPITLLEEKYKITEHNRPVKIVVQREVNGSYGVSIACGLQEPVVMHWGVNNWILPAKEAWPTGTKQVDAGAVQTPFQDGKIFINFPEGTAPENIKFVLKQLNPQAWHNCGGTDFHVVIRPTSHAEIMAEKPKLAHASFNADHLLSANVRNLLSTISEFENQEQLSLFQRFSLALELVPAAEHANTDTLSVLLAWLRYSANKQLPWHKGNTYKASDMAKVQQEISQRFADVSSKAEDPSARQLARQILALLPRGGGEGGADPEEIPGGLVKIMHSNNVREGQHKPKGIDDKFLEEWKHKLEASTTQEDVAICEAYLHFLHSGDWNQFYRYIWDNHRISRNRLESMDRPIRSPAVHLPQLIPAMKHFLWVLKMTHSGITLDETVEFSKKYLDEELKVLLYDILASRNEWFIPGKIADARASLAKVWRRPEGAPRDVLMLDIALEKHFRLCIERTDKSSLKDDDVIEIVNLVLRNAAIAGEWPELDKAQRFWDKVRTSKDRWSKEWVARASAAANFITVALEAGMDRLSAQVQQPAAAIGHSANVDEASILMFAEELVSSQSPAILGELVALLEKPLREKHGLGQWVIASAGAGVATGRLLRKKTLTELKGVVFPEPTILLVDTVKPEESVPEGVVAVIASGRVDAMGHLAVQARARRIFLAGSFDSHPLSQWALNAEKTVNVAMTPAGEVVMTLASPYIPASSGRAKTTGRTSAWVISEEQFTEELVGGKGLKCRELRQKMGSEVEVPATIALPFGTFERVLADPINGPIRDEFVDLVNQLHLDPVPARLSSSLEQIRMLLSTCLAPPDGLSVELASLAVRAKLVDADAAPGESDGFSAIWDAICKVWSSKWTDRAWLSRRARGEPDSSVYMSVLLQQIVPAQFSFMLHTADTVTGTPGNMSGEVVVGLGEALFGPFPGRALTFSVSQVSKEIKVKTLPSKAVAFRVSRSSSLIARPDWSAADEEDYAGLRLFESAPVSGVVAETPSYADEELVWDPEFQSKVLREIAEAGWKVESSFGGKPLEIEGVYSNGKVAVVQVRPQVFCHSAPRAPVVGGSVSAR